MATHLRTELVTGRSTWRSPAAAGDGLVHHSDRGTQYTSLAFGRRLREAGIAASMGSTGDCYDNAMAESFFATLEVELIDRSDWAGPAEARAAVFEYIEVFYNRIRRHSAARLPQSRAVRGALSFSPGRRSGMTHDRPRDRGKSIMRYRRCVARVDVVSDEGTSGVGTALQVGDGWMVTAAHVIRRSQESTIRGGEITRSVAPTDVASAVIDAMDVGPRLEIGRCFYSDLPGDLALVETNFSLNHYMTKTTVEGAPEGWQVDHVPIGSHLNDWLGDDLTLSRYAVLGFPLLPGGSRGLVADGGYMNAVVDPPLR